MNGLPHPNIEFPPGTKFDDAKLAEVLGQIQDNFDDLGPEQSKASPWAAPVFVGTFKNYETNGQFQMAGYRKGSDGRVYLRGLIGSTGPVSAFTTVAFTLPVGFRPSREELFSTRGAVDNGAEQPLRIDVTAAGSVLIGFTATNHVDFVSLSPISFYPG